MAALALGGLISLACMPWAEALSIQVAQESAPGAGDFDANVLGFITPFQTPLTTAAFYRYNTPHAASYNGELNGGPAPLSSVSQVFVVDASDGLSLVVVHDRPDDGSGGSAQDRWNLLGDSAAQVLADDPAEPLAVTGGTQFDSTKTWLPCCTDGYAIGSLDGPWTMFGQFMAAPDGITTWQAVDALDIDHPILLLLIIGRRIRLHQVPEPATFVVLFSGLAGLAGTAWRARRRRS